jgi:hypothetical protein
MHLEFLIGRTTITLSENHLFDAKGMESIGRGCDFEFPG